jgi:hypothetical protein
MRKKIHVRKMNNIINKNVWFIESQKKWKVMTVDKVNMNDERTTLDFFFFLFFLFLIERY